MIEIHNEDCLDLLYSGDLDNKKICIVTDPPFNVGYKYNTYKDNLSEEEYYDFLGELFTARHTPFVVIHYPEALYKLAFQVGMFPEKICTWVYNSNNQRQHRDIAYFGVKPDFSQMTQPYKNPNDKRVKKLIEQGKTGARLYDWWNINQVENVSKEKLKHPCQMPIEVMKNVIGVLPKDYIIFDPFMGSGTTGAACKELGYDFIGCEVDADYYDICKSRLFS